MKNLQLTIAAVALTLSSGIAWAADGDPEATIRLMGNAEADLPEAVTKEITLPAHLLEASAAEQAATVDKAARGLDKANARHERRNNGQMEAEEARERGAEMSEKAHDNRENRGRAEDHPTPPDSPPGRP